MMWGWDPLSNEQFSERFAVNLATYDYRHLDQDLSRVRAMTVSRFRSDYQGIQGDSTIGRAFKSNQAISTAKVASGPFVASLTKDDARVLLVVEQTTRGKSAPQPQTRRQQLDVFLVRITAGWRVDWVDIR